ncbi:hypothetical protein HDC90_001086 [Pedobacter sp. AK013]|uniref:tyrosine-type recombinase/integrase n=1 Tax=Pedobacter sp. AK013 TaxID=2723071 RepID=UPI0016202749|nr:hypothetical protein [Pedobacter sp. AK013]MBB6236474.1 hypothetical protein [Pedobacter sp. AK013]
MFFIGRCRVRTLFWPFFVNNAPEADFVEKGHKRDTRETLTVLVPKMASTPKLSTSDPNKWYIYFNVDVPVQLWGKYPRKRMRFKVYDDINRYKGKEREDYAAMRLNIWKYALQVLKYSPFDKQLARIKEIKADYAITKEQILQEIEDQDSTKLYNTPIQEAFDIYLKMRETTAKSKGDAINWKSTVGIFKKYFKEAGLDQITTGKLTRKHIVEALGFISKERSWGNTTYNNNRSYLMMIINWLAEEEYLLVNPALGKIKKLKENHKIHTWYSKEIATEVKRVMLEQNDRIVYRASQFTYMICIRSQQELMKLKADDIDRTLKRVRFRSELSKNGKEAYRSYPLEFEKVLDEIGFNQMPKYFYLFGKGGVPGENRCAKNTLSNLYKPIKDKLGLSHDYTIYGWKHTRVVHEMMKETNPYEIQHLCRHSDLKETMKYMRDFDIDLKNKYSKEDLCF